MLKPRRHLTHLAPYELPKGLPEQGKPLLQLAQNENFADPSPHALAAAKTACAESVRYPDPDASGLRAAIAALHDLDPERIVCARGAMELIALLATVYLEPGVSAVTSQYGYLYFRTAIELSGAEVLEAPEPTLTLEPDALADRVVESTRLVFVANPGNPTGSYLDKDELLTLRDAIPESTILVIDEAYAEFVDANRYRSCFDMAESGNTVILRTFSKIYGLAGLRIGWGYFPREIAATLRVVQQPNGVTVAGQAAATAAIGDQSHVQRLGEETIRIRERFIESVRSIGLHPLPSQGNFVLIRFDSAGAAADADAHLRDDAIMVRRMDGYRLTDCLRVTLGAPEQMQRMIDSLARWGASR